MNIIVITIAATLVLIGIVAYFITANRKKDVWEGELIDKREETDSTGEYDTTVYALYVKTSEGLQKRVTVRKKLFNEFATGDRIIKIKGETYPKKAV